MRTRTLITSLAATVAIIGGATACSSDSDSQASAPSEAATSALPDAPAGAPTIVLVHGAFADNSSWDAEIGLLHDAGYQAVAFSNPLRRLGTDAEALQSFVDTIDGPVLLVGHSYAGMVVSQVAAQDANVVGVVYVAAFIPEVGESVNSLNSKFPGSQLIPDNLQTVPAPGGLTDVYVRQASYGDVYAGGLDPAAVIVTAATQRPVTAEALGDIATAAAPATTPKWMIVATEDHAVPTEIQKFMADRAQATIVEVASGHDVPAAQPDVVARTIAEAAS